MVYSAIGLGAALEASTNRELQTIPWPARLIPLFLAMVGWPLELAAYTYYLYVTYLRKAKS